MTGKGICYAELIEHTHHIKDKIKEVIWLHLEGEKQGSGWNRNVIEWKEMRLLNHDFQSYSALTAPDK